MNIIIPMAGRGSRLRPHTLTTPKPLLPIAGKPIVQRLVEDISKIVGDDLNEIAFVIGDFGDDVEAMLLDIASSLGAVGSVFHQEQPLGTAHAVQCAASALKGPCVVAFADTLFRADFTLDADADSVVWVKQVEDPSAFGVVQLEGDGSISSFVEKPDTFVSDLAIIGIYYFKSGERLLAEINHLIDNDIKGGGEYQLTHALDNMRTAGLRMLPGTVDAWMDCGNKDVTVETNGRVLEFIGMEGELVSPSATITNSTIIQPCFIGEGAVIRDSIVGPRVSLGAGSTIVNCELSDCLIQGDSVVSGMNLVNSMIGAHASLDGKFSSLSLGDYCRLDA